MSIRLEKKSISITRLKLSDIIAVELPDVLLKRKASRLRDWNSVTGDVQDLPDPQLEKKSISITRLKHLVTRPIRDLLPSWKEKHLDYEIETTCIRFLTWWPICLEKKSISITRLKQLYGGCDQLLFMRLKRKASRLRDWNKGLIIGADHHLENLKRKASRLRDWNSNQRATQHNHAEHTWKEKHLDYEIETRLAVR